MIKLFVKWDKQQHLLVYYTYIYIYCRDVVDGWSDFECGRCLCRRCRVCFSRRRARGNPAILQYCSIESVYIYIVQYIESVMADGSCVFRGTLQYCYSMLQCSVVYYISVYYISVSVLYYAVMYYTMSQYSAIYTALYCRYGISMCCTILYCDILYRNILYYAML